VLTVFAPSPSATRGYPLAGREIVEHGLPRAEELTILGCHMDDQQWLAQLSLRRPRAAMWASSSDILLVLLALALAAGAARSAGASALDALIGPRRPRGPGAGRSAPSRPGTSPASSGCW
jgi:hypothetical protein